MEKLRLEEVSLEMKEQGLEYIKELIEKNSHISGVGSLDKYINNYEEWIEKQEEIKKIKEKGRLVPGITYYLIRESDNKVVGMSSLRFWLNENLSIYGGHIGYSIRPSERRKGYNKINLYLTLLECQKHGIEEVILDCKEWNEGSYKTMESLGGKLIKKFIYENEECRKYSINVNESIEKYRHIYEPEINKKLG